MKIKYENGFAISDDGMRAVRTTAITAININPSHYKDDGDVGYYDILVWTGEITEEGYMPLLKHCTSAECEVEREALITHC
jgi:hypothetical protein